ncbi:MAG: hypothetical protein WC333_03795 [Dehalococcoidia bacterium]
MRESILLTKTKVAMWWLILIGIVLIVLYSLVLGIAIINSFDSGETWNVINPTLTLFLGSILYFVSGILIFKRNKRARKVAIVILSIVAVCSLGSYIYMVIHLGDISYMIPLSLLIGFFIYLTPMILLILDRKNYFAMVRQREIEKKAEP